MRFFCFLILFVLIACEHDQVPEKRTSFDVKDHWTDASSEEKGEAKISIAKNREVSRIRISQLKKSVDQLFDGLAWERKSGGKMQNALDLLSLTLGQADYIRINEDNLEASTLFLKFVDDMASDLCNQAAARDAGNFNSGKGIADNLIFRFKDIDENLKFLKLKFHGQLIASGEESKLDPYKDLYSEVIALKKDEKTAWEAVCIMLMTEPEFYTF